MTPQRPAGRQGRSNLVSNVALLLLQALFGLWFTPYLVHNLGAALYGLVPLVASIATYSNVVTTSVQTAARREVGITLAAGGDTTVPFSTALVGVTGAVLVLVPVLLGLSWAAPSIFDVPAGYESAARGLFLASLLGFALVEVRGIISAPVFARNRIDAVNAARTTDILLRVAIPVVLFTVLGPQLELVGAGTLGGALTSLVVAALVWRALARDTRFSWRALESAVLRRMVRTASWLSVDQVGVLLHATTDVITLNLLLGATVAGRYGTMAQWPIFLRSLALTIAAVLAPVMLARQGRGEHQSMRSLAAASVRLLGLGMAAPAGLIAGLAAPLVTLWLGSEYTSLAPILAVSVIHLGMNMASVPLYSVQVASGAVRRPALAMLVTGILNVGLSIAWVHWGADGLGVAVATLVALTINNTVFTPLYAAHVLRTGRTFFVRKMLPGLVASLALAAGSRAIGSVLSLDSWLALGGVAVVLAGVYLALVWRFVLHAEERDLIARAFALKAGATR